jgi:hypothetical protein
MKRSVLPMVLLALNVSAFAQSNSKCSDMANFPTPGLTLEITRAEIVPAGPALTTGGRRHIRTTSVARREVARRC